MWVHCLTVVWWQRAGYTIEELFQLSRSINVPQRCLALSTLSKIIRNVRCLIALSVLPCCIQFFHTVGLVTGRTSVACKTCSNCGTGSLLLVGRQQGHPACKKEWGDDGGGHWLVWMEWRPARWLVCVPLLIFPCTIKSRSSVLVPAYPGWSRKKGHKTVVVWCSGHQVSNGGENWSKSTWIRIFADWFDMKWNKPDNTSKLIYWKSE